jgi:hypothetical protein
VFAPVGRNDLGNCFRLTLRPFYDDKLSRPPSRFGNAAVKTGLAADCTAIRASALVIWRSLSRVCCGVVRSKTEARSDKSRPVLHGADITPDYENLKTTSAIFESDRLGGPTFRWTEN